MKTCTNCKVEYAATLEYFYKHKTTRDGLRGTCKVCVNKATIEYNKANREKVRETQRLYYINNPDKRQLWAIQNPDKKRESRRKAIRKEKALKKGLIHEDWTEPQLLSTYGTDCYLCHEPVDLDAPRTGIGSDKALWPDHVVPTSKGGENTIRNVRPCHRKCNESKRNKSYEEYMLTVNSQEIVTQS